MNKAQLLRSAESLDSKILYTQAHIIDMIEALDDNYIDMDDLKEYFKQNYDYTHDLPIVYAFLDQFKAVPLKKDSLVDVVDQFKKIARENDDKVVLVVTNIGKNIQDLVFKKSDFLKIEGLRLFLKDDKRVIHLFDVSERSSLIAQMNS